MMFAILGLRSLYFVLSALQRALKYLNLAVGAVLIFIAAKLAVEALLNAHLDPFVSLLIVLLMLGSGVGASLIYREEEPSAT